MALAGALQVNTMLEELDLGETDLVSTCTFSGGGGGTLWMFGGEGVGPREGVLWISSDRDDWMGGENQNLKKSLDQNVTLKKSHAEFLSHKSLLLELRGWDM